MKLSIFLFVAMCGLVKGDVKCSEVQTKPNVELEKASIYIDKLVKVLAVIVIILNLRFLVFGILWKALHIRL